MLRTIASFEIKRLLKAPSTYIYFLILFVVSFFMGLFIGGAFKEIAVNMAGEKILANSPLVVDAFFTSINGWIGAIIVIAIIGNAVLKDFRYNTHNLIFTTPVSKFDYLFGRFAGAVSICLIVLTAPAFGLMSAYATPWVNADRIGTFMLEPYIHTYWHTIVPNAILQGAIFFSVSLISREIFIIWLSLILFWIGMGLSNSFFSSLQYETLAALLDPLGSQAKRAMTKYWSTYDKNHLIVPFSGLLLLNRLLWLAIAVVVFIIGYVQFKFTAAAGKISFKKPKLQEGTNKNTPPVTFNRSALPQAQRSFTTKAYLSILWGLSVNECKTLLRNTYFRIILLFGMLFLFLAAIQLGKVYETKTLPVTYTVLETLGGSFTLFIIILTIVFSGEIVWRAKEQRMDNILDALPVPNWVFYVSKISGLFFMQAILSALIMVCGMLVQLFNGYTQLEALHYVQSLFGIQLIDLWYLSILCVLVHTLVNNKFIGYFIVALFYIWNTFFAFLVLKHNLWVFSSDPGIVYSDMNGFGHGVGAFIVFKLYWGALAVFMAILTDTLWARGTEKSLKLRWQQHKKNVQLRIKVSLVIAFASFIAMGAYIYYNTNVLNEYLTSYQQELLQIKFEQQYRKYEWMPQPKIQNVRLQVDLYPSTRRLHAAGSYVLSNRTNKPIEKIFVNVTSEYKFKQFSFNKPCKVLDSNADMDIVIYGLNTPLAPNDSIELTFDFEVAPNGFKHSFSGLSEVLENGTFINNTNFLPSIGYNKGFELSDNQKRKKHNLTYRPTSNAINDSMAQHRNLFTQDADFINFEATVSTEPDQIAIAPGYLQKEWTENNRRYFHYKMDSKILNFYSFLSARYAVKKDSYQGINLEIYYHKGHEYNLNRMMQGMKDALSYYSGHFAPYQHKQVRIIEFPRYATFAQSFPNTIPFSEGIGFIADVDDSSDDVDYVYYVTAHEVAHQWFAHQIIGGDVEGSNVLSETLAQFGSITVLEGKYGSTKIRKFLKLEEDKYLTARSNESEKEKPLLLADAGQGYILYQKGGIVMHALANYLGQDTLNHAIGQLLQKYGYQSNPYPTTLDLVRTIRSFTPDSMQYFVTDCFEKITIYDNKIESVKYDPAKKEVAAQINIQKFYADSSGKELKAPCLDYVDVALFSNKDKIAQTFRYKLAAGKTTLHLPANTKPYKVVIDPQILLMDKKPSDNEKRLDEIKLPQ